MLRCISKGSFEHIRNREQGFRLSGYLYVALVDLIILVACCFITVQRTYVRDQNTRSLNAGETSPLLTRLEFTHTSRKTVIRKNWAALATLCLTLLISNSLFPGITSQFHGNYNCSSSAQHVSKLSSFRLNNSAEPTTKASPSSDQTGWFVVILFGCYSVADAIGKNLPIHLRNCLQQDFNPLQLLNSTNHSRTYFVDLF